MAYVAPQGPIAQPVDNPSVFPGTHAGAGTLARDRRAPMSAIRAPHEYDQGREVAPGSQDQQAAPTLCSPRAALSATADWLASLGFSSAYGLVLNFIVRVVSAAQGPSQPAPAQADSQPSTRDIQSQAAPLLSAGAAQAPAAAAALAGGTAAAPQASAPQDLAPRPSPAYV
jgi:hypothetical protein